MGHCFHWEGNKRTSAVGVGVSGTGVEVRVNEGSGVAVGVKEGSGVRVRVGESGVRVRVAVTSLRPSPNPSTLAGYCVRVLREGEGERRTGEMVTVAQPARKTAKKANRKKI